uniref:Uncharacterized protein n=1 Tax=Anguilla anguilla TaxID=7936 RepID=A0A0E9P6A3_ANGAN
MKVYTPTSSCRLESLESSICVTRSD